MLDAGGMPRLVPQPRPGVLRHLQQWLTLRIAPTPPFDLSGPVLPLPVLPLPVFPLKKTPPIVRHRWRTDALTSPQLYINFGLSTCENINFGFS